MRLLFGLLVLLVAAPAAAAPALFVVRDADTEITLFGSIHALPKGENWQSPRIMDRFTAADTLVLEAVMPEDPLALAPVVQKLGFVPGGKPLSARIAPEFAAKLPPAAAASGVPIAALDQMATWLAAVTLSEASFAAMGLSPADGVEPALTARAKAAKKPIIGLETAEQQLGYLAGLPEADQVKMLEATLDDVAAAKQEIAGLMAAWRAGNVETIARDFASETRASPVLQATLLTNRNRRWADWMVGVMKRPGKLFVAVGAGHLGGTDGLVAMLKSRGLSVEAMP
ncbi:TraB/GumN family protein [Sandarakinorhabdus sp. DWP1-3-1]|uniref:TraB/GumN family protein n=1 Tax=Sandarakinorhabdus sp. DWP1-3-1 TaxID=2804627 RepID=UPI003CEFF2AB